MFEPIHFGMYWKQPISTRSWFNLLPSLPILTLPSNTYCRMTTIYIPLCGLIAKTWEKLFTFVRFVVYSGITHLHNDYLVWKSCNHQEFGETEWVRCNDSMHYYFDKEPIAYTHNVMSVVSYHRNLSEKNCRALIYRWIPFTILHLIIEFIYAYM